MAGTVPCPNCRNINPRGQAICLACQADLTIAPVVVANEAPNHGPFQHFIGALVILLLVAFGVHWCANSGGNRSGPDSLRSSRALLHCQKAIKAVAANPSAAKIPGVSVDESALEFRYVWRHGGGLRLQNGFGALMDASATCVISKSTRKITELTIDGRRLR